MDFVFVFCALLWGRATSTQQFFVSTDGDDSGSGSLVKPWKTLQKCIDVASEGDQCTLRGGRYEGVTTITGSKHVTIAGYTEDATAATIDGSRVFNLKWELDHSFPKDAGQSCVYRSSKFTGNDAVPWQLWLDELPLTPARWPNAKLSDFSVFQQMQTNGTGPFAYASKKSSRPAMDKDLVLIDDGSHSPSLKDSGIDFTDTLVVQAFGAMGQQTTGCRVKRFDPAAGSVTYSLPSEFPWSRSSDRGHPNLPYFFEGHPKLLDASEEWSYDSERHQLLIWLPGCADPNNAIIRGRVQDVSLVIRKSMVTLSDLTVFGTTFSSVGSSLQLQNVTMAYPTFNKRSIGNLSATEGTTLQMHKGTTFSMFNSIVLFSDSPSVFNKVGDDATFVNNLFKGSAYAVGASATIDNYNSPHRMRFEHNTVEHFNAFSGIDPGYQSSIKANIFRYSGANVDGAAIHIQAPYQSGTVVAYNWIADTVVKAIRCDRVNSPTAKWGENATISNNVAWNTAAIFVKGDRHTVRNNVIFHSSSDNTGALGVAMYGFAPWSIPGENDHTEMSGNIADSILNVSGKLPRLATNNIGSLKGSWWREQFMDVDNFDFRPKPGSECATRSVGAYSVHLSDVEYRKERPGRLVQTLASSQGGGKLQDDRLIVL